MTKDTIIKWFYENYEDPANGVPRKDREYNFINGGPYDAYEEISNHFPTTNNKLINEIIEEINADSSIWVKKGQY